MRTDLIKAKAALAAVVAGLGPELLEMLKASEPLPPPPITLNTPQPRIDPNAEARRAARRAYVEAHMAKMDQRTSMGLVITVLARSNPKRGKSAERFAKYQNGMTVRTALHLGVKWDDVRWDVGHKFISVK